MAYQVRTMTAEQNPTWTKKTQAEATELVKACVRGHSRLRLAYGEWRRVWNVKGHKNWGLKAHLPKIRPGVPVHFNGVPVHISYCPILNKLYRYTFRVYRYTFATASFRVSCTGTL